jgi:hypothetical protein
VTTLAEFQRRLTMLSEPGVENIYQTAPNDCGMTANGFRPPPCNNSWRRGLCCENPEKFPLRANTRSQAP